MKDQANKEKITLVPDERAALVVGLKSEAEDPDCSLEEAIAFAKQRRQQWTIKDPRSA